MDGSQSEDQIISAVQCEVTGTSSQEEGLSTLPQVGFASIFAKVGSRPAVPQTCSMCVCVCSFIKVCTIWKLTAAARFTQKIRLLTLSGAVGTFLLLHRLILKMIMKTSFDCVVFIGKLNNSQKKKKKRGGELILLHG